MTAHSELLLEVKDLNVSFSTEEGIVRAVDEVSFELRAGEVLAVVGESGSGKSVTAMTLMGLTRSPNARFAGSARLRDLDLIAATGEQLRAVRGEEIAMIFQDPMTSLNPVSPDRQADRRADPGAPRGLRRRGPRPGRRACSSASASRARRERFDAYPHEFSGGMRQRVMIALALSCDPAVLIADEPTTALDVTIQAQILQLFKDMRGESNTGIILVTHDLGVVADIADRIAVMYAGRIVEQGTTDEIFYNPQHPYTWGLLGSITRVDRPRPDAAAVDLRAAAVADQPAAGLPLPPALPARARGLPRPSPRWRPRVPGGTGHTDRCVLSPEQKAKLRQTDGQIGLEAGGVTV